MGVYQIQENEVSRRKQIRVTNFWPRQGAWSTMQKFLSSSLITLQNLVTDYGRTLSDASMLYFADVFLYFFLFPP